MENSGYSDIFTKSPLCGLRSLPFHLALLDQCAVGGQVGDQVVRERTHFQSSHEMHHLHVQCPGGHQHLHLRGRRRAATSARYPVEECRKILADSRLPKPDHLEPEQDKFPVKASFVSDFSSALNELRQLAEREG